MSEFTYTTERFTTSLIPEFISLYQLTFKRKTNERSVRNMFGNQQEMLGYLAFEGKKVIGFYGAVPVDAVLNGRPVKAAQSVSTMVHPDYRTGELFLKLAELTEMLAVKEGISFIFGWPNSPRLFKGLLHWKEVDVMQDFVFKVPTLPLAKVAWKLDFLKPVYSCYFRLMVSILGYNNLKDPFIPENRGVYSLVPRSHAYLEYKRTLGSSFCMLGNKKVWFSRDYRLRIGDTDPCSLEEFEDITGKLKILAFFTGLTSIVFSVNESSAWKELLEKKFKSGPGLVLMMKPLNNMDSMKSPMFTGGDMDTF